MGRPFVVYSSEVDPNEAPAGDLAAVDLIEVPIVYLNEAQPEHRDYQAMYQNEAQAVHRNEARAVRRNEAQAVHRNEAQAVRRNEAQAVRRNEAPAVYRNVRGPIRMTNEAQAVYVNEVPPAVDDFQGNEVILDSNDEDLLRDIWNQLIGDHQRRLWVQRGWQWR